MPHCGDSFDGSVRRALRVVGQFVIPRKDVAPALSWGTNVAELRLALALAGVTQVLATLSPRLQPGFQTRSKLPLLRVFAVQFLRESSCNTFVIPLSRACKDFLSLAH